MQCIILLCITKSNRYATIFWRNQMVNKYIKKPIPIEAVQYDGNNFMELYDFANGDVYSQDG